MNTPRSTDATDPRSAQPRPGPASCAGDLPPDLLHDLAALARQASTAHCSPRGVRRLARLGFVERQGADDGAPRLTDKARQALAAAGLEGAAGRAAALADTEIPQANGSSVRVLRNEAESPLAWLRRRKGADGRSMLGDAEFAAGERFRMDFTRAGMMPRTTANWDPSASAGGARGPAGATDAMIAARQRFDAACRALGSDLAGLLVDVCGFLKGLEHVERERGWPARSAKVVLLLGLGRLAEHYGFRGEVRGPDRSRGIRGWAQEA